MDRDRLNDYLAMLRELRNEGIAAEIFSGDTKNITKQIAYADKVGIPFVIIAGSDEFERGEITVKNLIAGRQLSEQTADRDEWLKASSVQQTVPRSQLISFIRKQLHE
jgi:histidyl-tRNA synthetase